MSANEVEKIKKEYAAKIENGSLKKKFLDLVMEFQELKKQIFGNQMFVEVTDSEIERRYDQLLAFFYPQFRDKNYISPMS